MVGFIPDHDLPAYYYASQVVILPSTARSEAFGLVQLHAQACSRPVITTNLPGVSTVTQHGRTGLIIPPHSLESIVKAVAQLLKDRDLREEMGVAGYQRVTDFYQACLMAERIQEVYESLQ